MARLCGNGGMGVGVGWGEVCVMLWAEEGNEAGRRHWAVALYVLEAVPLVALTHWCLLFAVSIVCVVAPWHASPTRCSN